MNQTFLLRIINLAPSTIKEPFVLLLYSSGSSNIMVWGASVPMACTSGKTPLLLNYAGFGAACASIQTKTFLIEKNRRPCLFQQDNAKEPINKLTHIPAHSSLFKAQIVYE